MYIVVLHVCVYEGVGSPVNCHVGTGNGALTLLRAARAFNHMSHFSSPYNVTFSTQEKRLKVIQSH